jgi:E3 ubiquitin-protein ligase UBR3
MNVNVRELKQHVVYEPESYYAAFGAELEVCSAIMWSLVVHLNDAVSPPPYLSMTFVVNGT